MQAQLEEMSKQMAKEKKKKQHAPQTTPSPKQTAPSPSSQPSVAAAKPKSQTKPAASAAMQDPSDSESDSAGGASDAGEAPLSVGARNNRLRRLCELKPSMKLKVPQRIHQEWKKGGHAREQLMAHLEAANWDKDYFCFVY